MKRLISILVAFVCFAMATFATKVYINPGHGAWHGNCRPMETIPYPNTNETGMPDTLGFYESNTNLWKCLYLEEKLMAAGVKVQMSRRANGGENGGKFDKGLTVIASEAHYSGADIFVSIHSNAGPTGADGKKPANYPSYWYRGVTGEDYSKGSIDMSNTAWPYTFDIHHQKMEFHSAWSLNSPGLYADISFWNGYATHTFDGVEYVGYYGVLRHGVPGYLMETYFHTYQPACHRALNPDWCCQDGLRNYRGIAAWFKLPAEKKGYIMGYIRDAKKEINQAYYTYRQGNDIYHPINGAKVQLKDANGTVIKTNCYHYVARQLTNQDYYLTDNNYNGVFVYENLEPGTYTITVEKEGYQLHTETIVVNADKTSYTQIFMNTEIVWELNGGTVEGGEEALPDHVTSTYTLPTPTKEWHDFVGWYDNAEGTGEALTEIPAGWQGTLYAIWKEIEAEVKWVLNGGKFPEGAKVPTNLELWEAFKPYYNTYYGLNRSPQSIENVATFAASKMEDIMTNDKSDYKWLGDYIIGVAGKLSGESAWRWHVHAFFNCNDGTVQGNQKVATADFSQAGKPSAWGKAYQKVYGEEIVLPRYIAEEYTIPTPIKEDDVFLGWYDNNNGTGTALTVLPVGYKGTVYAIWKNTPSGVENLREPLNTNAPMFDVLGRQVDATYRGVIIQNGQKYLLR